LLPKENLTLIGFAKLFIDSSLWLVKAVIAASFMWGFEGLTKYFLSADSLELTKIVALPGVLAICSLYGLAVTIRFVPLYLPILFAWECIARNKIELDNSRIRIILIGLIITMPAAAYIGHERAFTGAIKIDAMNEFIIWFSMSTLSGTFGICLPRILRIQRLRKKISP
jgi:hypothetical protein